MYGDVWQPEDRRDALTHVIKVRNEMGGRRVVVTTDLLSDRN